MNGARRSLCRPCALARDLDEMRPLPGAFFMNAMRDEEHDSFDSAT